MGTRRGSSHVGPKRVIGVRKGRRSSILSRARIALGLVAVATGTAWAVGGAYALRAVGSAVLRGMPALAIATGLVIFLRAVLPRGPIAGPLVLIVGGLLALAAQVGWLTASLWQAISPTLLITGGVLIAMSKRARPDPLAAIVTRHWSLFLPNRHAVRDTSPHKFIVRCLLGDFLLDLTNAAYPRGADRVTIDVTVLGGWVELRVPHHWVVIAGRVELTAGVRFVGNVDLPEGDDTTQNRIVLNVQGLASRMIVSRSHPSGSSLPPGASPSEPESDEELPGSP